MKKKDDYYVNQHSCFLLQYHLVLVTKYRKKVIIGKLKETLLNYTKAYFADRELNILEVNTDHDHIHIVFEAYPNMNLSVFVNSFKSGSSRYIRKIHAVELSSVYWKPYFWSASYFVCTVSEKSTEIVKRYIQNQDS